MFADILEENEDLPLISFDQSILGGTPTTDPSPLPDGYVSEGGGATSADFAASSPGETLTGEEVLSGALSGSGYVGPPAGSHSPSPAPPPVSTPSQLTLPPQTTPVPSRSPSPPAPSHTLPSHSPQPPATNSTTSKTYVNTLNFYIKLYC